MNWFVIIYKPSLVLTAIDCNDLIHSNLAIYFFSGIIRRYNR